MSDFSQLGFTFEQAAAARRVWTVHHLLSAARGSVEKAYTDIYVEGEISNFKPADSGHLYFTLKDGDAQLRVVMFRTQARLLRFKPAGGMQVIARGRLTIYETRGELQLSAEYLEPKGAGALQVAFEQLKQKLAAEGLFDRERKRPIPALPRRIGVVTSPRGAAIQDILNILKRRHESVHVLIYPAQVQGESAASEVASGVRYFSRRKTDPVDVIIIARGGGSIEDLAAFNDEGLARVIAASEVPVISAVGHETDFTIADFVADLRAPTPSAAAELVIESKHQLAERSAALETRLRRGMEYRLLMARKHVAELVRHGAFARIHDRIGRRQQRVDELVFRIAESQRRRLRDFHRRLDVASTRVRAHDLRRVLAGMHRELESLSVRMGGAGKQHVSRQAARAEQMAARLNALSPLNILERGYALVFDEKGALVKDPQQVKSGGEIGVRVARGEFRARKK